MTDPMPPREVVRTARVSGVRMARAALLMLHPDRDPIAVLDRLIAELESQADPLALPPSFHSTSIHERISKP